MTFLACALHQLFVRLCHLGAPWPFFVHMSVSVHTTAPCSICLFGVCPCCLPVLVWTNLNACGCLLAPLSGITLTTRPIRSQHYTLSLLTLPRRPRYQSPHHLWMPLRRLSHTAAPRDLSTRLSFREFLAPPFTLHVRCLVCARSVPLLHLDAAVQTLLHSVATHDASTQLPLTGVLHRHIAMLRCILSNDPLDCQALPSAHCNAGSASPPQPLDIASLCSPSSASHASDGHEHTTTPHVLLEPPPGLEK